MFLKQGTRGENDAIQFNVTGRKNGFARNFFLDVSSMLFICLKEITV